MANVLEPHYIGFVASATMALNLLWNNRCGPGGSTRRLHQFTARYRQIRAIYGGETGSTRVVKTVAVLGMVPPISGHFEKCQR